MIDRLLHRGLEAFFESREVTPFDRASLLMRIASYLESRKSEFADSILEEAKKPITLAEAEVNRAIWTFTDAADQARRFHEDRDGFAADAFPSGANHTAITRRFPIGIVYGMTPFNFPLNLVAHKIAPAIACGNSIVIKPSPRTVKTARMLIKAINACKGAIDGQVQLLKLPNEQALEPIRHPRVRYVSFTGSVPIGWKVYEAAARAKKRATLELGGNAGCIVHHDVPNIDDAIKLIATGAFAYAGQSCISVQRLFVHESIADDFIKRFVAHVEKNVKCGDPRSRDVLVGPMIDNAAQQRVLKLIADARAAGANILTGGEADGACIRPTVITNAKHDLDVCMTEAFAPLVVIDRYGDFDEALAYVNASFFGLQAGVFTSNTDLAERAFQRLRVGGVMINQVPTFRLENQPYGGVKDSGLGREGVRYAIDEMTELKTMIVRK